MANDMTRREMHYALEKMFVDLSLMIEQEDLRTIRPSDDHPESIISEVGLDRLKELRGRLKSIIAEERRQDLDTELSSLVERRKQNGY